MAKPPEGQTYRTFFAPNVKKYIQRDKRLLKIIKLFLKWGSKWPKKSLERVHKHWPEVCGVDYDLSATMEWPLVFIDNTYTSYSLLLIAKISNESLRYYPFYGQFSFVSLYNKHLV